MNKTIFFIFESPYDLIFIHFYLEKRKNNFEHLQPHLVRRYMTQKKHSIDSFYIFENKCVKLRTSNQ